MFFKSGPRLTDLFGNLAGSRRRCQTQLMVVVEPKSVDVPLLCQDDSVISGRCNLWAVMGQKTLHHSGNLWCEHRHQVLESRCRNMCVTPHQNILPDMSVHHHVQVVRPVRVHMCTPDPSGTGRPSGTYTTPPQKTQKHNNVAIMFAQAGMVCFLIFSNS